MCTPRKVMLAHRIDVGGGGQCVKGTVGHSSEQAPVESASCAGPTVAHTQGSSRALAHLGGASAVRVHWRLCKTPLQMGTCDGASMSTSSYSTLVISPLASGSVELPLLM